MVYFDPGDGSLKDFIKAEIGIFIQQFVMFRAQVLANKDKYDPLIEAFDTWLKKIDSGEIPYDDEAIRTIRDFNMKFMDHLK